MEQHQEADFWFIGPYREPDTDGQAQGSAPVYALREIPNCQLTGLMTLHQILEEAPSIDIWLACYDPAKSVRAGTNSHKILEYLATGRAVLSNRFEAMAGSDLVCMPDGVSSEQLRQVYVSYMKKHPDEWHWEAAAPVLESFYLAWPCKE